MTRTEKEKMLAGELYNAGAPELQAEMAITYKWLARYNAALGASASDLRELLPERLAAVGEGAMIRPPFHCDYGFNISLGAGMFLNFNCVILDVVEVTIGDRTQIGPGVQILTADHPRDAASGRTHRRRPPGRGVPGAPATARSSTSVKDSQPVAVRAVAVCMQSAAAARETRIDHEVHMGILRLCPRTETLPRAVGAQNPALSIVVQVCLHDLVEDLLVHGGVFDRNQCFHPAVEVARPIGRRDEHRGLRRR